MPSGGARPGAGRPRKREKFARPIARAEKQIADRLPMIVDRLLELAAGVLVQDVDQHTGEVRVYQAKPDRQAAEYLVNRILGKPVEQQHVTGDDKWPLRMRLAWDDGSTDEDTDDQLPAAPSRPT